MVEGIRKRSLQKRWNDDVDEDLNENKKLACRATDHKEWRIVLKAKAHNRL
jgi:hypothetical protein